MLEFCYRMTDGTADLAKIIPRYSGVERTGQCGPCWLGKGRTDGTVLARERTHGRDRVG